MAETGALVTAAVSGPASAIVGWGLATVTRYRHDRRTALAAERARHDAEMVEWRKHIESKLEGVEQAVRRMEGHLAGQEAVIKYIRPDLDDEDKSK